jgi:hypothetical protein
MSSQGCLLHYHLLLPKKVRVTLHHLSIHLFLQRGVRNKRIRLDESEAAGPSREAKEQIDFSECRHFAAVHDI